MNRLILVGNGFDLAHGMKTRYFDFIYWYLKKCLSVSQVEQHYKDDLIHVHRLNYTYQNAEEYSFKQIMEFREKDQTASVAISHFMGEGGVTYRESNLAYKFKANSDFFHHLLTHCCEFNWVDIENTYYEHLKRLMGGSGKVEENLKKLNTDFAFIIKMLEQYLLTQEHQCLFNKMNQTFTEKIKKDDIVTVKLDHDELPENVTVINFNYTKTVDLYRKTPEYQFCKIKINIIHIHGELASATNPIIFGFGDEVDEDYKKLESEKRGGFLNFIKSFWYFKTSNYHDLIRFIESGHFQVYTMGHSCGLSDRTMLSIIFEHDNCKSIKIFPYVKDGYDNYTDLTQEISRHFKDKGVMRKKIINRLNSEPMPQMD